MNEKYIARSGQIAFRVLGEDTIIMSAADSTLFNLNEVATVIWESADGHVPLSEIVHRRVCVEFDVSPEVAFADALAFAEELARHGILHISDRPIPAVKTDVSIVSAVNL
jgi:Coenzyme PQQ synthesis protein D (PqqD)